MVDIDFQRVFEHGPFGAFLLDPDLIIVAATEQHLRATGTTRAQVINRYVWDVFQDNPDDPKAASSREAVQASFDIVKNTLETNKAPLVKIDVVGATGLYATKYWRPVNSPILDANGDLLYIFNLVEDVTVPTKAILALRQVGSSLEEISRVITINLGDLDFPK